MRLILLFDSFSYLCDLNTEDRKEGCVSLWGAGSLENCAAHIP